MSSSEFYIESFKIRESELRRAAEQHRLLAEAEQGAAAAKDAGAHDRKGGGSSFRFRGVRRSRRASAPSAC
ncbi:hypothetical protein [Streptacidiphilus carbonis]|jgi:hypothetical protein|uniref:hypothetical protein n=1 Tax=Streptacidiphilus carbonis TaxID=105422 RepID=UPI0005A77BBC|nr:hypothetical protein [Streptacidiphilus carbonis]